MTTNAAAKRPMEPVASAWVPAAPAVTTLFDVVEDGVRDVVVRLEAGVVWLTGAVDVVADETDVVEVVTGTLEVVDETGGVDDAGSSDVSEPVMLYAA